MARKKPRKTPSESLARKAKRLGIVLPTAESLSNDATKVGRQVARKGQRNRTVGVAVSTKGASLSGRGRITRFVVADGDGYAVRMKGRQLAGGFATPGEAARYADALQNRRFRKLADPSNRLPKGEPTDAVEQAVRTAVKDRETVASLMELVNSGAVRVTVRNAKS